MSRAGHRKSCWFHCARCAHRWVAAQGKLSVDRLQTLLLTAICPSCGAGGEHIALVGDANG
jgi:hypothetical protein